MADQNPPDFADSLGDPLPHTAPQPASVPVRVTWAEFWIAQGDWETAHDYAAFEKAERWLLAQQPASVDEAAAQRLADAAKGDLGWSHLTPQARVEKARRYLALAAQQQGGRGDE